ncbi:Major facilitator superfamily domain-containing protein 6 [Armadillidium vulgare]|nr:Major facilitator superfamily domain-containing protein 6 [Armadillidium vulgare]
MINYKLLPMKLHYAFMYGASAPLLPYLPVYMHEKLKMSYNVVGLIFALLPILGFVAKMASGAVADFFKAHRMIFLLSIIVYAISSVSIKFSPAMPMRPNATGTEILFDCSSSHSYLRHFFSHNEKCFKLTKLKTNVIASCEVTCQLDFITVKEYCRLSNVSLPKCAERDSSFTFFVQTNLSHLINNSYELLFPLSSISFGEKENLASEPFCNPSVEENCTVNCDVKSMMETLGKAADSSSFNYSEMLRINSFWIFLLLASIMWSAFSINVVMSDTICFKLLGGKIENFGKQRLFGSIASGTLIISTGFLVDITSNDLNDKNYTAIFVLAICISSVDFVVALWLQVSDDDNSKLNFGSIKNLCSNARIVMFVLCCYLFGTATGMIWTYQLILVEETINAWDCNFEYLVFLQGSILGVSCFAGEIPFFFLSGYVIKKMGHVNSMSVIFFVFGIRLILISLVVNPWLFLPLELPNGFSFGIFYSAMASYASIVAPSGGEATVQGIFGATFEGIGSFIGGVLFTNVGGTLTFRYIGIFCLLFAVAHVIFHVVMNKVKPLQLTGTQTTGNYTFSNDAMSRVDQPF